MFGGSGTPSGFANPTTSVASGFSFGAGTPTASTTATPAGGFSFGAGTPVASTTATPAGGFGFVAGTPVASTTATPTGGFNFGGTSTLGGGTTTTQSGLTFGGGTLGGTPTATTQAGLTFGGGTPGGTTAPQSSFTLGGSSTLGTLGGATTASTQSGFSLGTLGGATTASNPSSFMLGGGSTLGTLGGATTGTSQSGGSLGFSLTGAGAGATITAPTTKSGGFGFTAPLGTATTSASNGLVAGGGVKLGTATIVAQPTSSVLPTLNPGSTAAKTLALGTVSTAAPTTTSFSTPFGTAAGAPTTVTTSTAATTVIAEGKQMNYRQLEESINKWMVELEDQEKIFLQQATQVNAWDRLLMENGEKITDLNSDMERVKIDQQKLDHELDFIHSQQRELEQLLTPLEKSMEQLPSISYQQHADLERENTYQLAENIDAQLKRMMQDLKEIIEHLNTSNSNQDNNDPIHQITKILNAHMDSLQWIDQNTALLGRKVEDISKQMETQRKEQERNFRLVYD